MQKRKRTTTRTDRTQNGNNGHSSRIATPLLWEGPHTWMLAPGGLVQSQMARDMEVLLFSLGFPSGCYTPHPLADMSRDAGSWGRVHAEVLAQARAPARSAAKRGGLGGKWSLSSAARNESTLGGTAPSRHGSMPEPRERSLKVVTYFKKKKKKKGTRAIKEFSLSAGAPPGARGAG